MSAVTDRVETGAPAPRRPWQLRRTRQPAPRLTKRRAVRAVAGTTAGRIGLLCALVVTAVIVVGSLRHYDATAVNIGSPFQGPSWAHPLGTDDYGRDELARVAAGGRTSLLAATLVMAAATAIALVLGTAAGLLGGPVDSVLMRIMDVLLSIPSLVLAMAVIGAFGPGFGHLVIALSISYIASFTKMTRAFALSRRHSPDLAAARLAGVGWWRSMLGHVAPRIGGQLTIVSTLSFGDVVISIAALSFLGLGVQPPTPEWGAMLSDARSAAAHAPWLLLAPGLAIVLTAVAVNLIADALREGDSA
jgi:ABC-type dipeptide/oligopeptide/nickel transport system permease subunit